MRRLFLRRLSKFILSLAYQQSTIKVDEYNMITRGDIAVLESQCLKQIREDELYTVRNDAKLRAALTSKNFNDFKNIVDAAHLTSLSNNDKMNAKTQHRIWNNASHND